MQQPGLERPGDRASLPAVGAQRGGPLGVAYARAPQEQVGVAGERLRRAVHHRVGAEVERSLSERRRERVVDGQPRAGGMGGVGHRRDVAHVQRWVGGRLDPHDRRARARGDDRVGVGRNEPHLHAAGGEPIGRHAAHAGVAVARGHEDVARPEGGLEQRADRGHAGGEQHALGVLQRTERGLHGRPGRVALTPVAERRRVDLPAQVERRREDWPGRQRRPRLGGRQARVDGPRGRSQGHVTRCASDSRRRRESSSGSEIAARG